MLAPPDPPLAGAGVVLREWRDDDLPLLLEAATDARICEVTSIPESCTRRAAHAWVDRQRRRSAKGEGLSLLIEEPDGAGAAGAVMLSARTGIQAGAAGIGYWVVARARGRGLATRAVRTIAPWAMRPGGFARLEALVEPDNVASLRAAEAAGFVREGVLRDYAALRDRRATVVVLSLLPSDLPAG